MTPDRLVVPAPPRWELPRHRGRDEAQRCVARYRACLPLPTAVCCCCHRLAAARRQPAAAGGGDGGQFSVLVLVFRASYLDPLPPGAGGLLLVRASGGAHITQHHDIANTHIHHIANTTYHTSRHMIIFVFIGGPCPMAHGIEQHFYRKELLLARRVLCRGR
jgi:hypothetical protein